MKLKRFDLHWLIELIPEGFWMLFPIARWQGSSQTFGRGGQRGGNRKFCFNFEKILQKKLENF